jgi:hypothetical protein
MAHWVGQESEHMVRSLVAETAVIPDKFEEGSELAKVGITADEARRA